MITEIWIVLWWFVDADGSCGSPSHPVIEVHESRESALSSRASMIEDIRRSAETFKDLGFENFRCVVVRGQLDPAVSTSGVSGRERSDECPLCSTVGYGPLCKFHRPEGV